MAKNNKITNRFKLPKIKKIYEGGEYEHNPNTGVGSWKHPDGTSMNVWFPDKGTANYEIKVKVKK